MKYLLFFVLFISSYHSFAGYTMKDLKILVDSKEYSEALAHMKDVVPSERNDEWKNMALKSALGMMEKESKKDNDCYWLFRQAQGLSSEFAFFDNDPEFKKLKTELGLCVIKKRNVYDREELVKLVDGMLSDDPSLIYRMVFEADYQDPERRFLKYLEKNAVAYQKDERVKKYLTEALNQNFMTDGKKDEDLKKSLMEKFKLKDNIQKDQGDELKKYAQEAMTGDFTNDFKGKKILVSRQSLSLPIEGEDAATFIVSQYIVAINTHEMMVPFLAKLSQKDLTLAQKNLINATPSNAFWFSGGGWDDKERIALVKKYLKDIIPVAKSECALQEKDSSKEPKHVAYNCQLIKGW